MGGLLLATGWGGANNWLYDPAQRWLFQYG